MQPRFHYNCRVQDWVLLAYRLPREPSTPRIALWRRLRRLGAAQVLRWARGSPVEPADAGAARVARGRGRGCGRIGNHLDRPTWHSGRGPRPRGPHAERGGGGLPARGRGSPRSGRRPVEGASTPRAARDPRARLLRRAWAPGGRAGAREPRRRRRSARDLGDAARLSRRSHRLRVADQALRRSRGRVRVRR